MKLQKLQCDILKDYYKVSQKTFERKYQFLHREDINTTYICINSDVLYIIKAEDLLLDISKLFLQLKLNSSPFDQLDKLIEYSNEAKPLKYNFTSKFEKHEYDIYKEEASGEQIAIDFKLLKYFDDDRILRGTNYKSPIFIYEKPTFKTTELAGIMRGK